MITVFYFMLNDINSFLKNIYGNKELFQCLYNNSPG